MAPAPYLVCTLPHKFRGQKVLPFFISAEKNLSSNQRGASNTSVQYTPILLPGLTAKAALISEKWDAIIYFLLPVTLDSACMPHHITQRGNRREEVFFTDDDRRAYLAWLKDYAEKYEVDILAYCLGPVHIQ